MCRKIYMGNTHVSFESPAKPLGCASIADIEDEIALLSATISAATCRLICLIGELDRRDGWADPLDSNGFRSCAHWLSPSIENPLSPGGFPPPDGRRKSTRRVFSGCRRKPNLPKRLGST